MIIGGGIAGLTAANYFNKEGIKYLLLEAEDRVGGRIKTDYVKGYQLDRGFQVLLTSYPECKALLDYEALHLKPFHPGALVQYGHKAFKINDPFRKPITALRHFSNPFTSFSDKLKILALRNRHRRLTVEQIFNEPEMSTLQFLQEWNFSKSFIQTFLKPFLNGIFLEEDLKTSSRFFEFVFKMFAQGYASLPQGGMEAIPQQLAKNLNADRLVCNAKVAELNDTTLTLVGGQKITAKRVLIATDALQAEALQPKGSTGTFSATTNMYFSANKKPLKTSTILLNGNASGIVNSLSVLTNLHESYAPPNKQLISVSINRPLHLNDLELIIAVRQELKLWFGAAVEDWMHLKTYVVDNALPLFEHIEYPTKNDIKPISKGVFACGDYTCDPSINGAMRSGRLNAEAITWDLSIKG